MKKSILTFCLIIASAITAFSQTDIFSPEWYIVKSGALFKVIQGNSDDALNQRNWIEISYSSNEVLLVFNFSKDIYYCYDPEGRVVLVKGKTNLQKIEVAGKPVYIKDEVKIGLDHSLNTGNHVWVTAYNASTKTATILLADGQKADIPQSSIQDLKEHFDPFDKYTDWHTVK